MAIVLGNEWMEVFAGGVLATHESPQDNIQSAPVATTGTQGPKAPGL